METDVGVWLNSSDEGSQSRRYSTIIQYGLDNKLSKLFSPKKTPLSIRRSAPSSSSIVGWCACLPMMCGLLSALGVRCSCCNLDCDHHLPPLLSRTPAGHVIC